jgi:hypothetical protein
LDSPSPSPGAYNAREKKSLKRTIYLLGPKALPFTILGIQLGQAFRQGVFKVVITTLGFFFFGE